MHYLIASFPVFLARAFSHDASSAIILFTQNCVLVVRPTKRERMKMKRDHRQFVGLLVVTCFVLYTEYVFYSSSHSPKIFTSRTSLTYKSYNTTVLACLVPVTPTRTALCTRYDGASKNFSMQDIIVRAAYFDDRPQGNHRNSTVILIEEFPYWNKISSLVVQLGNMQILTNTSLGYTC